VSRRRFVEVKAPFLQLIVLAPLLAANVGANEVLFQDDFAGKLGDGWSWVREEKAGWRAAERGLELRVLPGNLWGNANNAKNVLVRSAPDADQGDVEISVTITNRPTHQYEQANLAWYYDDRHMVKLGLELVDNEVCIVMGREAGDQARTLGKIPIAATSVRVRLFVAGRQIRGEYLPLGGARWLEAGAGDLPAPPKGEAKISLHCYQGPPEAEHWARFSEFRVLRRPGPSASGTNPPATDSRRGRSP
jgi:regulation of enolase protein 1 (concanavalin A-like superfamily)